MSKENVELVRAMWLEAERGNLDPAFWDPDLEIVNADGWALESTYRGHEGLARWWEDLAEAFEEFGVRLDEAIDLGDDRVLTVQRFLGRFRTTGIEFDGPWASVVTVRDGKVVRGVGYLTKERALRAV